MWDYGWLVLFYSNHTCLWFILREEHQFFSKQRHQLLSFQTTFCHYILPSNHFQLNRQCFLVCVLVLFCYRLFSSWFKLVEREEERQRREGKEMWMEREKEERDEAVGKRDGEREGWMKRQNNGESNEGERQGVAGRREDSETKSDIQGQRERKRDT